MNLTFQTIGCVIASIVVIAFLYFFLLWWVPKKQVIPLYAKGVDAKDIFKAKNDARTTLAQTIATLAQILGGAAVLTGLFFAWKNIDATNKNLELAKEGQVTERFTKAIEQLGAIDDKGKPKLELRLGGIYALERIAQDSEKDQWPIMEVLTAYVREHAQQSNLPVDERNPPKIDIQAILTVIGQPEWSLKKAGQRLDLNRTDLHNANLYGAHLEGANLRDAHLENADLDSASLSFADLRDAHLRDAHLVNADLMGAHLENIDLRKAELFFTHLRDAHLDGAHVEGTDLSSADLQGMGLLGRDLESGKKVYIPENSKEIIQKQINSAIGDASTKLPPGIVMPESWKKKVPN